MGQASPVKSPSLCMTVTSKSMAGQLASGTNWMNLPTASMSNGDIVINDCGKYSGQQICMKKPLLGVIGAILVGCSGSDASSDTTTPLQSLLGTRGAGVWGR
jgi:hypothetical protein